MNCSLQWIWFQHISMIIPILGFLDRIVIQQCMLQVYFEGHNSYEYFFLIKWWNVDSRRIYEIAKWFKMVQEDNSKKVTDFLLYSKFSYSMYIINIPPNTPLKMISV